MAVMDVLIGGLMMSESRPTFSIVVPVHNGGELLRRCLLSLTTLALDRRKYEIVVVDNNSTDRTLDIIKEFDVVHASETISQGSYAARNKGIQCSRGRFIAFTDADCIAHPDWLSAIERATSD